MNEEMNMRIIEIISGVASAMGLQVRVEAEEVPHKGLVFTIFPITDAYVLIGHRGEHLYAFEILVQSIVRKKISDAPWFGLDVDDYRRKREWYLKKTVQGAIEHMKRAGRSVGLVPMPRYERRFVHAYVQDMYPGVISDSMGEGAQRRVVLRSK